VAAEGVDGAAGVGFDDPCVWGIADDDAETAVGRCGRAVYWAGEFLVGEEDVCFTIEDSEVAIVGGENADGRVAGSVTDNVDVVGDTVVEIGGDEPFCTRAFAADPT
jgi:hypothetical protein